MEGERKPEITPENKAQELQLNANEFAFADKYGIIHKATSHEELMEKMEAFKQD